MTYCHGIDVSGNNGTFDWAAWPGIDFAFIKATEVSSAGVYHDPQFETNWVQAWDRYDGKLVRIAYGFWHPGESAGRQARELHDRVKGRLRPGDHFMLDVETTDGLPAAEVSRSARAGCHLINRLAPHHRCLVYTSPGFAAGGRCAGLGPWRLFVADWGVQHPVVPWPWRHWWFWQFAAGKDGKPDLDVFNGDRDLLERFAWMPPERRR